VESLTTYLDAQEQTIERLASHLLPAEKAGTKEKIPEAPAVEPQPDALLHDVLECLSDGVLISDASDRVRSWPTVPPPAYFTSPPGNWWASHCPWYARIPAGPRLT